MTVSVKQHASPSDLKMNWIVYTSEADDDGVGVASGGGRFKKKKQGRCKAESAGLVG